MHDVDHVVRLVGQLLSALLLAALGAWTLWQRPSSRGGGLFGVYALLYGLNQSAYNVVELAENVPGVDSWSLAVGWGRSWVFGVLGVVLLVALPAFPRDEDREGRLPAAVAFLVVALAQLASFGDLGPRDVLFWFGANGLVLNAAFSALLVALAVRFRATDDPARRRRIAFAFAGLAIEEAFRLGGKGIRALHGEIQATDSIPELVAAAGIFAFASGAFLMATRGPMSALARNVALLVPATALASMVIATTGIPVPSLGRFLGVAVLAYAVVRLDVFGLDATVRARSLRAGLAAFLLAGVFVAGELVQQAVGDKIGNAYVGILGAGAFVLAIAPLSRLADRWGSDAAAASEAEEAYRRALRLALRDRRLTPAEELELAHVAHALRLTPPQATRLRHEVEAERADLPADAG